MGKNSSNAAKSGKHVNAADQARKAARKKELRKNKKQRQMVRTAILKGTDPNRIINDLEKIDEIVYNVSAPPLLNEKVFIGKRKKLKETWGRLMTYFNKEDRQRYHELKNLEMEYESCRSARVKYYESVLCAQQVQVDDIPLPPTPDSDMALHLTSQIPLPNELGRSLPGSLKRQSILTETSAYHSLPQFTTLRPPGVPPGPPPELSSDEEEDADSQADGNVVTENKRRKSGTVGFPVDKGRDDGEFSDEDKNAAKQNMGEPNESDEKTITNFSYPSNVPVHAIQLPRGHPSNLPPGPFPASVPAMFRLPALTTGIPPRLFVPGIPPPPGRPTLQHRVPLSLPSRIGAPTIRLPPGPPPGMPPARLIRPPLGPPPTIAAFLPGMSVPPPAIPVVAITPGNAQVAATVQSVPPSLMHRPKRPLPVEETACCANIEAKPQIRSLTADVVKFKPTTLRIKREDRHKKTIPRRKQSDNSYPATTPVVNPLITAPTKDDAYQQFLNEIEEFL